MSPSLDPTLVNYADVHWAVFLLANFSNFHFFLQAPTGFPTSFPIGELHGCSWHCFCGFMSFLHCTHHHCHLTNLSMHTSCWYCFPILTNRPTNRGKQRESSAIISLSLQYSSLTSILASQSQTPTSDPTLVSIHLSWPHLQVIILLVSNNAASLFPLFFLDTD